MLLPRSAVLVYSVISFPVFLVQFFSVFTWVFYFISQNNRFFFLVLVRIWYNFLKKSDIFSCFWLVRLIWLLFFFSFLKNENQIEPKTELFFKTLPN